jgi:hypothetical protein
METNMIELAKAMFLVASYEDAQWGDDYFCGSRKDWTDELTYGGECGLRDIFVQYQMIIRDRFKR